jgi:hypothetical protein
LLDIHIEQLKVMDEQAALMGDYNTIYSNKVDLIGLETQKLTIKLAKDKAVNDELLKELELMRNMPFVGNLNERLSALDLEIARIKKLNELNENQVAILRKLEELKKREANLMKTEWGAFQAGLEETLREYEDVMTQMKSLGKGTVEELKNAFSTMFFDFLTGQFKSFKEYFKGFLEFLLKGISEILAKMLILQAFKLIGSLFMGGGGGDIVSGAPDLGTIPQTAHSGGYIMHKGGYVSNLHRYHGGGHLKRDERPAILQSGEYVVSRRGVAALDKINSGEAGGAPNIAINIENKSSQPVNAKQGNMRRDVKGWVIDIMLEDLNSHGPYKQALQGVR